MKTEKIQSIIFMFKWKEPKTGASFELHFDIRTGQILFFWAEIGEETFYYQGDKQDAVTYANSISLAFDIDLTANPSNYVHKLVASKEFVEFAKESMNGKLDVVPELLPLVKKLLSEDKISSSIVH
jgi:hypothetical protein